MNTAVDAMDDKEFFEMLRNPFTGDLFSTVGGERVRIATVVDLGAKGFMVLYPDLETYVKHEPAGQELGWHGPVEVESSDSESR